MEKSREQNEPIIWPFVDLAKAYDTIPREKLWYVLDRRGIPQRMLSVIRRLHEDMRVKVQLDNCSSEPFAITIGVRQGCPLPLLFNIDLDTALRAADLDSLGLKVVWGSKKNGSHTLIATLLYADDTVVMCPTREKLQGATNRLCQSLARFGLFLNTDNTVVMAHEGKEPLEITPPITAYGNRSSRSGDFDISASP